MKKQSALINGKNVVDITGNVQRIKMTNKETGQVSCGNGIVIYRSNHVNGHAPVFLSFNGETVGFGTRLDSYTFADNFHSWDYENMTIECDLDNNVMLGDMGFVRSECII